MFSVTILKRDIFETSCLPLLDQEIHLKRSTLKGKNLLLKGANSFLSE